MFNQGKFIVLEGLEGAGKSSAIDTVLRILNQHNIDTVPVREPGGTTIAEQIRTILKTPHEERLSCTAELLLMYAARAQLIQEVIRPALAKGQWIVADRFEWSTYAYQGQGRGIDTNVIDVLSKFCVQNLKADLIIYLDVAPEIGLKRAESRSTKDRIEQENLAFFQKVHEGYLYLAKNSEHSLTIDASLPLERVQDQIHNAVRTLLP